MTGKQHHQSHLHLPGYQGYTCPSFPAPPLALCLLLPLDYHRARNRARKLPRTVPKRHRPFASPSDNTTRSDGPAGVNASRMLRCHHSPASSLWLDKSGMRRTREDRQCVGGRGAVILPGTKQVSQQHNPAGNIHLQSRTVCSQQTRFPAQPIPNSPQRNPNPLNSIQPTQLGSITQSKPTTSKTNPMHACMHAASRPS